MLAQAEALLQKVFDSATLQRGRLLQVQGQVLDVDVNATETAIVGRVRGSAPKPYQQIISLKQSAAGVDIAGTCSCPMKTNCKHVVALLLHAIRRAPLNPIAAASPFGAITSDQTQKQLPRPNELSPRLLQWVGEIDAAITSTNESNTYPPEIKQRLIFVIELDNTNNGYPARPTLKPMVATLDKSGNPSPSARSYTPSNIFNHQPAKHLRRIDHDILANLDQLMRRGGSEGHSELRLAPHPQIARVLTQVLSTGRCRLGTVVGPILIEGPLRAAKPRWVSAPGQTARQHLIFEPEPDSDGVVVTIDAVLPTSPPFYVDASTGLAGPLETGLPPALAARLAEAPEVSTSEAVHLAAMLEQRLSATNFKALIPLPQAPSNIVTRRILPKPRLELFMGSVRFKHNFVWFARKPEHRGTFKLPMARLAFDYGGEVVPFHARFEILERQEDGNLVLLPRNGPVEMTAFDRLGALGLKVLKDAPLEAPGDNAKDFYFAPASIASPYKFLDEFDDPSRFLEFSSNAVPKLAAEGWQIAYSDDYPYRIAEGTVGWWADIESSGIDWFGFELGIEFEGKRISLGPHLAAMLEKLPQEIAEIARSTEPGAAQMLADLCNKLHLYHALEDGRLLPLPGRRLAPVLKALLELIGPRGNAIENGQIRLHRAEAGALASVADQLGDQVEWAVSAERLIALGRDLQRGRALRDITPPRTFKAKLRPYQRHGLAWLDFLRDTGLGGVLADDMGLGKTVQALAFLCREKASGRLDRPALILAPTSVLPNWLAEAKRFVPSLSVLVLHGPDRKKHYPEIESHDLVLTTYPIVLRDHETLLTHEFHAAILDEAQAIKNPKATITAVAHRIKARHRFALTGTPLENNLGEVWSLFHFLSPGLLGDETTFRRTFRTPIEKHGCQIAQSFLTRRLKPFMLRRTKQEVATELPAKTEIVERIQLDGAQRDLYETVRVLVHDRVRAEIAKKGLAKSHIIFLDALLKLRQICCDPRLLKLTEAKKVKQSAKLERLMEMLPAMVAEGRRILLFSQFTSMLELIEAELIALEIPYVQLTGQTADRAVPVAAFQNGDVPVFLLSLKAGGTGLNLTAADTVIHYDPWWNPAVENQATDRAYRIGQTKPVFVYKLMVEEGVEEAIELLKAKKAALAAALFEGGSKSGLDLSEADISALFAPLAKPTKRQAG